MSPTKFFSTILIAASILILSGQSFAQYRDSLGVPFNNPISASMSTMIWGHINRAAIQGAQRAQSGRSGSSASSRSSTSASSRSGSSAAVRTATPPGQPEIIPAYRQYPAVQFKPTGTRLTLEEYLKNVKVSEFEKRDLRELIPAIWTVYEEEAVLKGYPNDVALAFVSFIGLNSHIYAGRTEKLPVSFAQNIGLRDMVAEQVTDNGAFNNFSDRQKQELYELLTLLSGLTFHYYLKAVKANDVEEIKNTKLMAEQNLKLLGIKP
jgi:hypothetical protein